MLELVLIEITAVPAERSRGRHHPRVVKRKMSGFPTKARASPPPRQVFRYAEHVRIVAPAAGLERRGADPHLCRAAAEARSKDTDPGPPPGLARARPLLAGQRLVVRRLLRPSRFGPAYLPSLGGSCSSKPPPKPPSPHLIQQYRG
jgi:hypothetical protein